MRKEWTPSSIFLQKSSFLQTSENPQHEQNKIDTQINVSLEGLGILYIYLHVHAIYTSRWYVRHYVRIYMVCHGGDHSKKVIVRFLFFNRQVSRRRRCFGWQRCAQRRWVCRRWRRCHASHADCSGRSRLKAIEAAVASKTWENELYESLKTKTR